MKAGELFAVVLHGTQSMPRSFAVSWDSQHQVNNQLAINYFSSPSNTI